jgi:hypothetical protein
MPSGIKHPDFTGELFGMLTLRRKFIKDNRPFWECECVCGKIVIRRQDHLVRYKSRIKFSCGCNHPSKNTGTSHKLWNGCGDISGFYFGSVRNLEFNITIEYVWDLFKKQKGVCALSGLLIKFYKGSGRTNRSSQTASLDRIDPSLGYIEGNVQWVHKTINLMRHHYDLDMFYSACRAVARHHPGEVDAKLIDEAKGTRNKVTGRRPVTITSN